MLTPYDEYPVHQSPYPVSYVPATDTGWDNGYYFGVFSAEADVFVYTGLRFSPNTNMIGGYAGIAHAGRQYTARFSRILRPDYRMGIGPFEYRVLEPFRDIAMTLAATAGIELSFDLHWLGVAPPFEEEHHLAVTRGRRTTDQTRYSQPGVASGVIRFGDETFEVDPATWSAARDHSWGLYAQRAPIAADPALLPPAEPSTTRRAFRFWSTFSTAEYSGFLHLHESETGETGTMNDPFGTPFEGRIHAGWDHTTELADVKHDITFRPGTRIMDSATLTAHDTLGQVWTLDFTTVSQPWTAFPVGYNRGTWRDGGTLHTYHGSIGPVIEADELDISTQPFRHRLHDGTKLIVWGCEYLASVRVTDPTGHVARGAAQVEIFIDGRYDPYGFVQEGPRAANYWGGYAIVDAES
jgi:hypothetical protein